MLPYLKKYEELDPKIKEKISTPEISAQISDLEDKYQIDLPSLIIKIMIKEIVWPDLETYLRKNFDMPLDRAGELKEDLASRVFKDLTDYLNIPETGAKGEKQEKPTEEASATQDTETLEIKEEKREEPPSSPSPQETEEQTEEQEQSEPREKKGSSTPDTRKERFLPRKRKKKLSAYDHEGEELELSRAERYKGDWEDLVFSPEDEEELKEVKEKITREEKEKQQKGAGEQFLFHWGACGLFLTRVFRDNCLVITLGRDRSPGYPWSASSRAAWEAGMKVETAPGREPSPAEKISNKEVRGAKKAV